MSIDAIKPNNQLKIMLWNCNSIRNKIENLKIYIKTEKPDIILLNETKCDKETGNFFLELPGYETFLNPREKNSNKGGGVAIVVKETISRQEFKEFSTHNEEICCVKITTKLFTIHIFTYYNPPKTANRDKIISYDFFKEIYDKNIPFLLGGDLNSKLTCLGCKTNNPSGQTLLKIINDFNFTVANDKTYTYHEEGRNYNEILNLFLISDKIGRYVSDFKVDQDCDLGSDHYPVILSLNLNAVIYEKTHNKN
jgi:exonuclease III